MKKDFHKYSPKELSIVMVKITFLGAKVLFTTSNESEEELKILRASPPAGLLSSDLLCVIKFARQVLKPNEKTPQFSPTKIYKTERKDCKHSSPYYSIICAACVFILSDVNKQASYWRYQHSPQWYFYERYVYWGFLTANTL